MPTVIQPLSHDENEPLIGDAAEAARRLSPEFQDALDTAPQIVDGVVLAQPDLYTNVDPTIDDSGIIRSMTIKPAGTHTIDLESQISGVLTKDEVAGPKILASDMNQKTPTGGAEFMMGQELMGGGATVAPQNPAKQDMPQVATHDKNPPNIIIGQM